MILKDISVGVPYKSKIHFEGRGFIQVVEALYLSCIKRFSSGSFNKIVIELDNDVIGDHLDRMLEVILIKINFDFGLYGSADEFGRKKMILDAIQNGLLRVAQIDNLAQEPILDAYKCCIERGIKHEYYLGDKFYLSPDRRIYAAVWCNWEVEKFEAYIVFFDKKKIELYRKKIMESEHWNLEPFGKAGWDRLTGEFSLFFKDRSKKWSATFIHESG
jgi:hypothetical protein